MLYSPFFEFLRLYELNQVLRTGDSNKILYPSKRDAEVHINTLLILCWPPWAISMIMLAFFPILFVILQYLYRLSWALWRWLCESQKNTFWIKRILSQLSLCKPSHEPSCNSGSEKKFFIHILHVSCSAPSLSESISIAFINYVQSYNVHVDNYKSVLPMFIRVASLGTCEKSILNNDIFHDWSGEPFGVPRKV